MKFHVDIDTDIALLSTE